MKKVNLLGACAAVTLVFIGLSNNVFAIKQQTCTGNGYSVVKGNDQCTTNTGGACAGYTNADAIANDGTHEYRAKLGCCCWN
jgi:hypothetical protein